MITTQLSLSSVCLETILEMCPFQVDTPTLEDWDTGVIRKMKQSYFKNLYLLSCKALNMKRHFNS